MPSVFCLRISDSIRQLKRGTGVSIPSGFVRYSTVKSSIEIFAFDSPAGNSVSPTANTSRTIPVDTLETLLMAISPLWLFLRCCGETDGLPWLVARSIARRTTAVGRHAPSGGPAILVWPNRTSPQPVGLGTYEFLLVTSGFAALAPADTDLLWGDYSLGIAHYDEAVGDDALLEGRPASQALPSLGSLGYTPHHTAPRPRACAAKSMFSTAAAQSRTQ